MSRFERPSRSESSLPERLREGGGSELEQRVLEAAARELPSRELLERMASAVGVAAPPLAPSDTASPDLSVVGSPAVTGLRGLLPWISAGIAVVIAGAYFAMQSSPTAVSPVRSATVATSASTNVSPPPPAPVASEPPAPPVAEAAPNVPIPPLPRARPSGVADIQEQIALVDAARTALSAGESARSLELLRQYQSKYPTGSFRPEVQALRIEALAKLGRMSEAHALGDRFVDEHRGTALGDRVARVLGKVPP